MLTALISILKKRSKKKRQFGIYFLLGAFAGAGIISGLWSVPRFPQITISSINVAGNNTVPAETIIKSANNSLAGSFYVLFPKKNSFLYPKKELEKNIVLSNPQIASASALLKDFKNLSIQITERTPVALLCGIDNEDCRFLDEKGFIFAVAPHFSGNVYSRFFSTTTEAKIGEQFIDEEDFRAVMAFRQELYKNGLPVAKIQIEEGVIKLELDRDGEIIVALGQNLGTAMENLSTLLQSKEFKGREENGFVNFEYIGLRFGDKLFYKI